MQTRFKGLLLMLVGAGLAYFAVFEPLQQAANGGDSVRTFVNGVVLVPVTLLLGAGGVAGGEQFWASLHRSSKSGKGELTAWGKVVMAAVLVLSLVLLVWMKLTLKELGYE